MNFKHYIVVGWMLGLFVVFPAAKASADGGFFIDELASTTQAEAAELGLLDSSGQRAVLWQSGEDCWDLYLEPGAVELTNSAWVMPLPVLPEIDEASGEFIDQLDAATIPVFTTHRQYLRYVSSGGSGCGCMGDAAEGTSLDEQRQESDLETRSVTVWEQGALGELAYEIVSTEDANALQTWLGDHGYVVPDTLATSIAPYVDDDFYFFVAQVERETDDAIKLSVVRFHLCDAGGLWYPVRLSAYSVADELDFTLWFVDGPDTFIAPSNCSWQAPGGFFEMYQTVYGSTYYTEHREEIDRPFHELYEEQIESILEAESGRSMAVQYAASIETQGLQERLSLLEQSGVSPPMDKDGGDWTAEFQSIVDGGLSVTRWVGSFPASAMQTDLVFEPSQDVESDAAFYSRSIDFYNIEPPSEDDGDVSSEADRVGRLGETRGISSAGISRWRSPSHRSPFLWLILLVLTGITARRFFKARASR